MLFGAMIRFRYPAAASAMGFPASSGLLEEEEGYDRDFSAAANIATAPTGLLIPPSNVMITFSTGQRRHLGWQPLFMAGYIPGILWALTCMAVSFYFAMKRGYNAAQRNIPTVKR